MAGASGRVPPAQTRDQRLLALRQANEVRIRRAVLKQRLASGLVPIEDVLRRPPQYLGTAKVYDLLLAVPGIGPAKGARLLSHCRIAASKTVAGLTERQRTELTGLLRR
jgi:hypothetical protein